MLTGKQIRAARMLAGWDASELAVKAKLSRIAVQDIEREDAHPRSGTLDKIIQAFEGKNIEFLDNSGVRIKDNRVRELEGTNCYARLLDEVYYKLGKGEEFLVAWADERRSPKAVHEAFRRIVRKDIVYRKLVKQDNTYICGPLSWYRWVPEEYYQNAVALFYNDMSAYLTEDWKKIIIIEDGALAKANKKLFNWVWSNAKVPNKTTAREKYA